MSWLKALVVPLVMGAFIAAYWSDAWTLSARALAFPGVLTLIVIGCVAAILVHEARGSTRVPAHEPSPASVRPARGLWKHRAVVVGAPAVLVASWDVLGAAPALFVYAVAVLLMLGERRPLWLLLLPAGLSLILVNLFRHVLYLRLPGGMLGIGT